MNSRNVIILRPEFLNQNQLVPLENSTLQLKFGEIMSAKN
jgi:hypothetical protein